MFKELYTNKFISATNVIMNAMSALRSHFRMQTMQPVWLLILPSKTFEDTLKNEEFQAIKEDQVDKEMHNVGDVSSKGSANLVHKF